MSSFKNKIIELDSACENAIIDFPFHEHPKTWIIDYQLLFTNCTQFLVDLNLKKIEINSAEFVHQFLALYETHQKK